RPAGCSGVAGHAGRRPDALQQAARAPREAFRRPRGRCGAPRPLPRLTAVATNVYMEALSATMEEGRVVKWHKRDGDPVKTGETLAEVETDKAVMDLVARADGVLRQVAAAEGQTVAVGSVVAVIVSPGEAVGAVPAAAAPATPSGSGKRETGNVATVTAPAPVAVSPLPVAAAADATRVKASPLARRMAKEAGVDLKLLTGSGPGGRVVKKDLERAPSPAASAGPTAAAAATFPVSRFPFPERTGAAYDDVPLTQIRKTIAKRLATSLGPIPHFFLTTEVDMERASGARGQGAGRAGPQPPAAAQRVHRGDVLRLEPRHVRHRPVHGDDQSAGGRDHRRRLDCSEAGGRGGTTHGAPPHADHHELRPPSDRRRDGSGVPQDAQTDAGEPAGDAAMNSERGTRNAEQPHEPRATCSAFRVPTSALGKGGFWRVNLT